MPRSKAAVGQWPCGYTIYGIKHTLHSKIEGSLSTIRKRGITQGLVRITEILFNLTSVWWFDIY